MARLTYHAYVSIHQDGVPNDILREVAVESIWRVILAAGTERKRNRIGWISCTYVWPVSNFVCKGRFARVREGSPMTSTGWIEL